jgi:hypothetical protein
MRKQTVILAIVLLADTLLALAAPKPEPLTYKSGGRRYVITLPNTQLWSQSEVARSVQWHEAGKLYIDGKEIRQARLRGEAGDRTNRNYLVTVVRTGKRLSPSERYFVRPDPWTHRPAPPTPVSIAPARAPAKLALPSKSLQAPSTMLLSWQDVAGATPGGWGTGPLMMPDGGPRFWVVYCSQDGATWKPLTVTETNSIVIGTPWPQEFYRVHWRDEGAPVWRWP